MLPTNFKVDKPALQLPAAFQRGETVNVVIPGNAVLKDCRVIKISFDNAHGDEPRYDISVPYLYHSTPDLSDDPAYGFLRFHGLREAFLYKPEWNIEPGPAWLNGADER